jgi:hypothetical protein
MARTKSAAGSIGKDSQFVDAACRGMIYSVHACSGKYRDPLAKPHQQGDIVMSAFSIRKILAACAMLVLAACADIPAAPTATTDFDRSYNFSRVHKIAIQPVPKDTLATMMISDAQIVRISDALSTELRRRGFEVVPTNAQADMFLSWKLMPDESTQVATFDPATQPIVQGSLYVTMIDPLMLQSVWRASFRTDLREQPETPEAAQYRAAAAEAILAQFPPTPP